MAEDAGRGPRTGRGVYHPTWQCRRCGARAVELPDRCPDCGHDVFRAIELR